VLAIVIQASWRVGRRTLRHPALVAIAAGAFLALTVLRLPYPLIVATAALTGWIGGRLRPAWFAPPAHRQPASPASGPSPQAAAQAESPPIHDDTTPTPEHARFRPRRLALTLLLSGLALALPLAALTAWGGGWEGELARMARFFTRVALVSFGGAYAVLPYVAQGAVESFGWLDAHQMADGLALGETTPGPLIIVVAFVGFMGGWNGSGSLLTALQAGLVTVWFTFLPSFVFILAGAPLVEASREDLRLGPPLTAITAAVTGVIASLAVLLAAPALTPHDRLDGGAIAVLAASLALLLGRGWGVLPLIGAAALVGLARLALLAVTGAPP
jgi:chromate transporter